MFEHLKDRMAPDAVTGLQAFLDSLDPADDRARAVIDALEKQKRKRKRVYLINVQEVIASFPDFLPKKTEKIDPVKALDKATDEGIRSRMDAEALAYFDAHKGNAAELRQCAGLGSFNRNGRIGLAEVKRVLE